jgi:hypothetical protein
MAWAITVTLGCPRRFHKLNAIQTSTIVMAWAITINGPEWIWDCGGCVNCKYEVPFLVIAELS